MRRPLALLLVGGCASAPPASVESYQLTHLNTGSVVSMRGVSVVDAQTVWASGTGGSVLRTTDGGVTWSMHVVPNADSLDFRDIEAFDDRTAYVLSAGEDGRIYKTVDAGSTWTLQFANKTKGAFFDCFDFWDATHGIAMSDPVNGRFLLVRTIDGATWREVAAAPANIEGEAAFAASGSCIIAVQPQRAYLATGGGAQTRVLVSNDRGSSWTATATPVPGGAGSAGIFSLAFKNGAVGIAAGGDYQKPDQENVVARTTNGGRSWLAAGKTAYVSGAAFVPRSDIVVAVGTRGTRISRDAGATWRTLDTLEYNAVHFAADGTGYAVGPRGRIGKLTKR